MTAKPSTKPSKAPAPTTGAAHHVILQKIDKMVASGDFDIFFTALKGFRNGVVYGTRVRAPHALVLNLVWSKAPYSSMPRKIYEVTKTHALGLGFSGATFAIVRGVLKSLQGSYASWHNAVAGFIIGVLYWGDCTSTVHLQMMFYMLSRVVSALYHVAAARYASLNVPPYVYRLYAGLLWSATLVLLIDHPTALQSSMRRSLEYIFRDSDKFTGWYDVFCVNSADTF